MLCVYAQSCLTFCASVDCSPPGSSVHAIFQAWILEWVAISYSRGFPRPRDLNYISWVSCISRQILYYCIIYSMNILFFVDRYIDSFQLFYYGQSYKNILVQVILWTCTLLYLEKFSRMKLLDQRLNMFNFIWNFQVILQRSVSFYIPVNNT